jgi:hypothetical protein
MKVIGMGLARQRLDRGSRELLRETEGIDELVVLK